MNSSRFLWLSLVAMAGWTCSVVNAPDDPVEESGHGGSATSTGPGGQQGGAPPEGCGDGVVDPSAMETCDPPDSCPTSCDDSDACTEDRVLGAPEFCNVACEHNPITTCEATGDGCCPMGCDGMSDADCGMCGNMVVELGETCDGNCPADCDDMDLCTMDTQTGAATSCDLDCSYQTITVCQNGDGCCPTSCTVMNDTDCMPTVVVRAAVNRGWWDQPGTHDANNDNTITGLEFSNNWNNYFIFDLSGISGTVVDVTLRLEVEQYMSTDTSETVQIWDVSTNPVTLEASGTGMPGIWTDLQSGTLYGSFTVLQSQVGQIRTLSFNNAGRADVQAALGGMFAVGGHISTIVGTATQWVRFSASNEMRTHELVISYL